MSLVFVGGSQRSGTTLLNEFLCRDEKAAPKFREASYFRELVTAFHNGLADFDHDTVSYFGAEHDFVQFHKSVTERFIQQILLPYPEALHLILKEPHLTPLFPDLFRLLPKARYLLIVRDPRDIISSMFQVGERMRALGQSHFFQQRNIPKLCNYVQSFYTPSMNFNSDEFRSRLRAITYENLVHQPEAIQSSLRDFLGMKLNFDVEQNSNSEVNAGSSSELENLPRYQPWFTDLSGKAIRSDSIGSYKQVLSASEARLVGIHMAEFMDFFGYDRS